MRSIQLVKHQMEYCEQIFKLSSMPQIKDALGLPDGTVEDTKLFIERLLREEESGETVPRVILNERNKCIGLTDLIFIDYAKRSCHIGTWIGYEDWGKGYNEASKLAILEIAFERLKLDYVFAGARKINIRSQKAQEKLPFIRLRVEEEFPEEHKFLEEKERQPCVLNVFRRDDYYVYKSKKVNS